MKENNVSNDSQPRIMSLIKAFRILELFDPNTTELSLTQISRQLGIPKSTLLNFVRTLEGEGYLTKNHASQNYQLGIKFMKLGYNVRSTLPVIPYALPLMEDLCDQTKSNIYLTTHVDGIVLYLEGLYSNRRTTKYSIAGKTLPMHVTASGKCMLSYLPDGEFTRILEKYPLSASTRYTITDRTLLCEEIARTRELGYALDNEEETLGVRCLSMAVRDPNGYPVGALSISSSVLQMTDEHCHSYIPLLNEACISLARYASMFPYCPL